MTARIYEVDPRKDRLRKPRAYLLEAVRRALGGEVAGCALVVWDRDGNPGSWWHSSDRVPMRLIPAIAHDCLQQHVTMQLMDDKVLIPIPPPDDAS